jgi:hypothetical protein
VLIERGVDSGINRVPSFGRCSVGWGGGWLLAFMINTPYMLYMLL